MRQVICRLFLFAGVIFLAFGLWAVDWQQVVDNAPIVLLFAVGAWIIGWLLRRSAGCLRVVIPLAAALGLIAILSVNVVNEEGSASALLIASAICFIVFGVCISPRPVQRSVATENQ